jgi:hypothetical protein
MLSIKDGEALSRALRSDIDRRIKRLLRLRWAQVTRDLSDENIADLVQFIIVEPGETAADLERAVGFSLFGGGDAPGCEWAEWHEGVAEFCWVFSDDGAGVIAFISCQEDTNAELLNLCRSNVAAHS